MPMTLIKHLNNFLIKISFIRYVDKFAQCVIFVDHSNVHVLSGSAGRLKWFQSVSKSIST